MNLPMAIYKDVYKDRFPISERVNAYIKGLKGIYHVKGHNLGSARNQITLVCLLHNIIRLENIKDTYC